GMGQARWIDDNEADPFPSSGVNTVNQRNDLVALEGDEIDGELLCPVRQPGIDCGDGLTAASIRVWRPEIEGRSVQYENLWATLACCTSSGFRRVPDARHLVRSL